MVCYDVPLVLNHGEICCARDVNLWFAMLSTVVVNHGLLCRASDCESWFIMLSQWL